METLKSPKFEQFGTLISTLSRRFSGNLSHCTDPSTFETIFLTSAQKNVSLFFNVLKNKIIEKILICLKYTKN
jgi:hypothetical protein